MVTLSSMLQSIALICLIVLGGAWGKQHGHPGWGLVAGGLAFAAAGFGCAFLRALWWCWRPPLPRCRSGQCRRPVDFVFVRRVAAGDLYTCRCGVNYVLDRQGRRFLELTVDETVRPYLCHALLGRWRPDPAA